VRLTVEDSGIGIPPEDQPRLFESFHRASNVQSRPGTGLGLAIAKKSVELHGGTITFDTKVGAGTRFYVTLPRQASAQPAPGAAA
jgi:signal transduction histidine kinase